MRRSRSPAVFLLGTLILAGSGAAAEGAASWTALGPAGGEVDFVAAAPSAPATVYASSRVGGVFASDDYGATWRPANAGLSDLRIRCLAVSPTDPAVVFAGAPAGGFRSTDGGRSWTPLANGFPAAQVDAIAVAPSNASTVYATGTSGTLVRSTDGGASWASVGNSTVTSVRPRVIAVDPTHSSTLYLATLDGGVFRSDDGGGSWTAKNNGFIDPLGNLPTATAVAVDPTSVSRLYVGTSGGLVFRSDDGASSWSEYDDPGFTTQVVTMAVASDGTAFAALQQGVAVRRPTDPAWSGVPYVSSYVRAASIAGPAVPLYAAFGSLPFDTGGLGRWDGGGAFSVTQLPVLVVAAMASDPQASSGAVVASTATLFLYRPGDPAGPWDPPSAQGGAASAFDFQAIAVYFDPRNAGVIYSGGARVFRSADSGASWTAATTNPTGIVRAFVAQPGTNQALFAGTTGGLSQSADGISWSAGSGDLSARQVFSLAADPTAASTLWAGTDDGVYRSDDGGASWSKVAAAPGGVVHAVLVTGSGAVLAGADSGLFVSADRSTWNPAAGSSGTVFALAEKGPAGEIAAGGAAGVFVSTDGGATWSAQTTGLTNPDVISLAYLGDGTLLAGTNGGSVFERIETAPRAPVGRPAGPVSPRAVGSRPRG
ncbi:MAG TPA: YCF48-related protein [Thermoanaerobaculia bacterium]|nr:YCF48-related protein [Thermoanaerobaculia bacterium]